MEKKRYQLLFNRRSDFNPSHVYGRGGDIVTLVAEHGEVWIVEGLNGQRFPIPKVDLMEAPPEDSKEAKDKKADLPQVPNPVMHVNAGKKSGSRAKKPGVKGQQSPTLF